MRETTYWKIHILRIARGAMLQRPTPRRLKTAFADPMFTTLPARISAILVPIADAMRRRSATRWHGLMTVDMRRCNIVEWLRPEGNVTELFDVA